MVRFAFTRTPRVRKAPNTKRKKRNSEEILRVTSAHRILWAAGLVLRGDLKGPPPLLGSFFFVGEGIFLFLIKSDPTKAFDKV